MRNKKNNAQNCQLKLRADCSLDSAYAWLIANQYAAKGGGRENSNFRLWFSVSVVMNDWSREAVLC